jgi:hypothetical protein
MLLKLSNIWIYDKDTYYLVEVDINNKRNFNTCDEAINFLFFNTMYKKVKILILKSCPNSIYGTSHLFSRF